MTIRESRTRLRAAEQAYNTAKPGRDLTEARQELTHARAEYQAACVAMMSRLSEALEPFHKELGEWWSGHPDTYSLNTTDDPAAGPAHLDLGDLRRLSSIYKEIIEDA